MNYIICRFCLGLFLPDLRRNTGYLKTAKPCLHLTGIYFINSVNFTKTASSADFDGTFWSKDVLFELQTEKHDFDRYFTDNFTLSLHSFY